MREVLAHWTGRRDTDEGGGSRRWHELVRPITDDVAGVPATGRKIAFLGFCSDEGVRRNQGRPGAVRAPAAIRRACAVLPDYFPAGTQLFEAGDLRPSGEPLAEAQEELAEHVRELLSGGYFPLVFGGGHEVAWGTYLGLRRHLPDERTIGIINLDAHFDLRPPADGPTSGTAFYQIGEACRDEGRPLHYLCLGVQTFGNTRALFDRAGNWGVRYHLAEEMSADRLPAILKSVDALLAEVDEVYLSIDLDVFDSAAAPGVSAPNPMGLDPQTGVRLVRHLGASGKLAAVDIAELNPEYDIDGRTARLAAVLIFELLNQVAEGGKN